MDWDSTLIGNLKCPDAYQAELPAGPKSVELRHGRSTSSTSSAEVHKATGTMSFRVGYSKDLSLH